MPRSEWWITPGAGRCRMIAMVSASSAISVCRVSRIDQPMILRYADPIRRRGNASLRRWGCRSGRRAKPGRVYRRQSPAEPVGCDRVSVPTIRRKRAFSAARSDGDATDACVIGRRPGPVAWPPRRTTHRLSTVSFSPSSLATFPTDKPLLITRSTASRLKTSGNIRRVVLIRHLPLGSKA